MAKIDGYDFRGKRALIRVDFNVPIDKETNEIKDDTRLKASLKTIHQVLDGGGKVVLMSHLGRPKKGYEEKFSLKHLVQPLSELLNKEIIFVEDCIGSKAKEASNKLKNGEVMLLENLRFHPHETNGTETFAKELAQHGDVYINDAFGTAHRAHASTTVVAKFFSQENKMFGFLIEKEIESVSRIFGSGKPPVTAIVGGAKVSSKITILKNLLPKIDHLIIGGGMSYTFIKAQGGKIGSSMMEEDFLEMALDILEEAKKLNVEVHLPEDSVVADRFSNDAETKVCKSDDIPDGYMGLDIGTKAQEVYSKIIKQSKTILWNGPVGVFEMPSFEKGSKTIAQAIVDATDQGAFSLIGGGDSVAAINQFGLSEHVSHVSTGGGAMLEYLEGKTLPGIAAMEQ